MEENRAQLRRSAISFIALIYLFFVLLAIVAFFLITELENDNIVTDTQLERGVVTVIFLLLWTFVCYRLYRINMRIFDLRSQVFDAREAEHYAAREATRLREQFMANMSHEIRTPLNAIIGLGGLLQRGDLNERESELAANIQVASESLLAIVNDILDFSKLEAGVLVMENIAFDLNGLFRSVEQMFVEQARQKNLLLDVHLAPGLPEHLVGDPTRLTQILMNLIGNALKFTEQGGVVVSVVPLQLESKNQITLRIEVRDSGIGIPANQLEKVFERFTQSDEQNTRLYGGTGLGLSIVKQLVAAMHGTISLQSEPGKGSMFTVLIPFELNSIKTLEKTDYTDDKSTAVPKTELPDVQLLVVEDNPMNRRVVALLFEEWNCHFAMVQNGREAVEMLSKSPNAFDLVLMDIQMPEMDGYEATRQIRQKLGLQIPIVAMTAHALAGEREKCLQHGMNDYLAKPIRELELRQVIARFAKSKGTLPAPEMDRAYFQETTLGNPGYQKELAQIFLIQTQKDLDAIGAALNTHNFAAAAKAAHNMKSTVGYMGFAENIGRQLADFESACWGEQDPTVLWRLLADIRQQATQAMAVVTLEFVV